MSQLAFPLFDPAAGQGARQFAELGLALLLSTLIGAERATQQKSAGLRTHTLVGVGSALFMEVSQHGFNAVLGLQNVSFDPSRVAAQIVSGIGFIGGGLIFVRRDAVRGLTTAATVWLTCAVGMACGGGLPLLAIGVTFAHFLVVQGYPWLTRRVAFLATPERTRLHLAYRIGTGVLTRVLEHAAAQGFRVVQVRVDRAARHPDDEDAPAPEAGTALVAVDVEGTTDPARLVAELADFPELLSVSSVADESAD
ncbi:putative Mg2+ transporter-C (MgtC) family protein [Actinacidiphila alni]|uniref:Putative Mg2+ transporter-C (MgtC) family protein n=1 Tax=Actinacidiphila alni TaxID=380248 RepID=A0A1I2D702_9ACTN|nr:MgtC/SapB family protein [Actinacidiphila alni]SFE75863.1 putative Mg2+ transporter-C (MgtC) family protein [Actinacidiphila alni]